jgi:actin-related protein 2
MAGENFPAHIFPSMVGSPTLRADEAIEESQTLKDIMCGDEAAAVRSSLEIRYPVENGIVRNWDDMEKLWDYTFDNKLQIETQGHKILLTAPPMNPVKNQQKMMEMVSSLSIYLSVCLPISRILYLLHTHTCTHIHTPPLKNRCSRSTTSRHATPASRPC